MLMFASCLHYMFMLACSSALHGHVCVCTSALVVLLVVHAGSCALALAFRSGGGTRGAIVFGWPLALFVVATSYASSSGSRARQDAAGRGARRSVDGKTSCIPLFR